MKRIKLIFPGVMLYEIICMECKASVNFYGKKKAETIAAWNKRVTDK